MKKLIFAFIILSAFQSLALEMTNPVSLCDRFLAEPEQKACEAKISALKPDWYLATTCGTQDDDASFFQCLELSKTGNFAPLKLDLCTSDSLSDTDRLSCIKAAKTDSREAFQQAHRRPATTPRASPPGTSDTKQLPIGP